MNNNNPQINPEAAAAVLPVVGVNIDDFVLKHLVQPHAGKAGKGAK